MVYLKDFEYLKPKASKISYLQTFETTARKYPSRPLTANISLSGIIKPYIREYCDTSTLHGFRYFTHPEFKFYEKVIWLLIIIATSIACIIVYVDLAELYYTQRVQTTVADSVYPVFMEPFPSIGICLPYRIDWQRLRKEAPKDFLPANATNETLHTFYEFFDKMGQLQFSNLQHLSSLFDANSGVNLKLIDHLDILHVMGYLTYSCTEAFTGSCRWRTKIYNCCDLFTLERTELGYCYVFNSAISPKLQERAERDPYYPYHNSNAGEGTGLEVQMRINEDKISPKFNEILGVHVMLKQPEQWNADVKFVTYNTYTKLSISSQITETGERARTIPPDERRCIFGDEVNHNMYKTIPGLKYWRGNCRTRCHQEYLLKYCKCNLNLLFPTTNFDNFTICKPSDFKCIYDNSNIFSKEHHVFESKYIDDVGNGSMTCNCLNNCNQLLYDGFFNSVVLENINSSDPIKLVYLDVHFQSAYSLKYRTSMRYTMVELLVEFPVAHGLYTDFSNFGGIIGLFLGASLLSAVELVYYLTIGLYARLHKQLAQRFRQNKPHPQRTRVKYKHVKIANAPDGVHYKY